MSIATPSAPERARAPAYSRLRVAMLGCGFVAPLHLAGWRAVEGVEVVAVGARNRAAAEDFARTHGIAQAYDDLERMLDEARPDVLDLCTPPAGHLPQIAAAARRGVHVICQKPLAERPEDAAAIAQCLRGADIRFMVHENFRFRPWYREIKRQLDSGVIGRVHYARSDARMAGTVPTASHVAIPWSLARQPYFAQADRLLILESMIHQLDVCRFLFGEASKLYARARRVSPAIKGEDMATLLVSFDGLDAVVERSYASRGYGEPPLVTETMAIEGERGTLFLERDGTLRIEIDTPGERATLRPKVDLTDAYPRSYGATIAHFVERLRSRAPFETDLADNLKTLDLTFAAYRSLQSGQAVGIPDAVGLRA